MIPAIFFVDATIKIDCPFPLQYLASREEVTVQAIFIDQKVINTGEKRLRSSVNNGDREGITISTLIRLILMIIGLFCCLQAIFRTEGRRVWADRWNILFFISEPNCNRYTTKKTTVRTEGIYWSVSISESSISFIRERRSTRTSCCWLTGNITGTPMFAINGTSGACLAL